MTTAADQAPPIKCLPLILVTMSVTTFVLVHLGSHQQAPALIDIIKKMDHPGTYALSKFGKQIPPEDIIRALRQEDLTELLHEYLKITQLDCKKQFSIGSEGSQNSICMDYVPNISAPCLVYSFGYQKDFSLEEDIVKQFQCEVHSFDSGHGSRNSTSVNLKLHSIDLSDPVHDHGGSAMTLAKIEANLGHDERHLAILSIVAKPTMEWDILENIAKPDVIADVSFLFIDLHIDCQKDYENEDQDMNGLTEEMTQSVPNSVPKLTILKTVYDLGFRIYNIQTQGSGCSTVFRLNALNVDASKRLKEDSVEELLLN